MLLSAHAIAVGPDDEVITLDDEDILEIDDDGPTSLDHEALTDDAC